MTRETILVEASEGVATITLNRPQRLNAYTAQMGAELFDELRRFDEDDTVRAIIVTGAGRGFCAGADLERGGETFAGERTWGEPGKLEARVQPWSMRKPVICAINGPAVGIGATLPLWWDIRLASDQARIGFVFTRRGIVPEANSTWLLPRLIGMSRAMELMITGRILSAPEALEYGVVSRVVPHAELLATAREMALDIARNTAPVSVALVKRMLWHQLAEPDPRAAKAYEDALFFWSGKQPDAAEGVTAFLEKRAPRWTMSPTRHLPDEPLDDERSRGEPGPATHGP
jgi:enoyl-CoA hydratase/carnithine racemase